MMQELKLGVCSIKCSCARNNFNFPEFSSGTSAMFQIHRIYLFVYATYLSSQHSYSCFVMIFAFQPSLLPIKVVLAKRGLDWWSRLVLELVNMMVPAQICIYTNGIIKYPMGLPWDAMGVPWQPHGFPWANMGYFHNSSGTKFQAKRFKHILFHLHETGLGRAQMLCWSPLPSGFVWVGRVIIKHCFLKSILLLLVHNIHLKLVGRASPT